MKEKSVNGFKKYADLFRMIYGGRFLPVHKDNTQ